MRSSRTYAAVALAAFAFCITTLSSVAATWRSAAGENGFAWSRITIINDSSQASNWSISGRRTAVESSETAAATDASFDWDGVVPAGSAEVVWVYGLAGAVTIANADGGASTYFNTVDPDPTGDAELIIAIAADGTVSAYLEAGASYAAPTQTGTLPSQE